MGEGGGGGTSGALMAEFWTCCILEENGCSHGVSRRQSLLSTEKKMSVNIVAATGAVIKL